MRPPKLFRSKHHIAVVGLYRSGKTAFLASLINHVCSHRPQDLKLGGGKVRITFDDELETGKGKERFPYEEARGNIRHDWPSKTKSYSQFHCRFYRSDWPWTVGELTLLDIPGERLADVPIARMSYQQWSDWLLDRVLQDQQYRDHARTFVETCSFAALERSTIIDAYRTLQAELYRSYRPVITPSTFLLCADGTFTGEPLWSGDTSQSFCGLDATRQFVPLPRMVRDREPQLSNEFESHFLEYRAKIAGPLVKMLEESNELAVLIDVTTLLATNTGMYNGNKALLDQLIRILSPGNGLYGISLNLLKRSFTFGHLAPSGISRIAVVATKADKAHESQRENMTLLVKEMAEGILERLSQQKMHLDCTYLSCAAVKSTTSLPDGRLRGRLLDDGTIAEYKASDVPDRWPGSWKDGQFSFPDVCPEFPDNNDLAPDHLGMEAVMEFLLRCQA